MDHRELGADARPKPGGQVLPADGRRQEAAGQRAFEMEATCARHRAGDGAGLGRRSVPDFRFWRWRAREDDELDRELDVHLMLEVEEQVKAGVPLRDAQLAATRAFGSVALTKEELRDMRTARRLLDELVADLRYGVRGFVRSPGFTATAALTLAIGVGASTSIFSQINAVFWKTLPVDRPQELRSLAWYAQKHPFVFGTNVIAGPSVAGIETFGSFSYPAYKAMRDGTKGFSHLACWADLGEARPVVMRD